MSEQRPSFLVFVADQMQSACIGANGHPDVRTPNIDRLAAGGVSFRRAYVNNPVCSPSRASMITGLTPRQHGLVTNGCVLPAHVPTLTQTLVDVGFRTHAVGKLHLQPFGAHQHDPAPDAPVRSWEDRTLWDSGRIRSLPRPYYGFQTADFVGGHVNYCFGDYANWLDRHHPGLRKQYQMGAGRVLAEEFGCWAIDLPPELHYNHWIADRAIAFLEDLHSDEPFFLWCSFPDPHGPFAACAPYADMYDARSLEMPATAFLSQDPLDHLTQRRTLHPWMDFGEHAIRQAMAQTYGMITHVDHNIGRVLDHLHARGLARNTVTVFLADHGEYLGSHHLASKSVWPYEELLRSPFVWAVPNGRAQPQGSDTVVSLLDFAPTVLDYAGIDPNVLNPRGAAAQADWSGLSGRSLRAALDGGEPLPDRPAVTEFDSDRQPGPIYRCRTIVDRQHKLTLYAGRPGGLLFDLERDPNETDNRFDAPGYREVRDRLTAQLLDWLVQTERLDAERYSGA